MNRFWTALVSGLVMAASSASAQPVGTVTWFFNARTADGDNIIEPHLGEDRIEIELWADMDPDVDGIEGSVIGFGGSWLDLLNVHNGETGRITAFAANPSLSGGDWHVRIDDRGVLGMEPFQLPPVYNPDFETSDPILIASMTWSIQNDPTPRTVTYETSTLHNPDVYYRSSGSSHSWAVSESQITWRIVPAPSSLAALMLAQCALSTRRRPAIGEMR